MRPGPFCTKRATAQKSIAPARPLSQASSLSRPGSVVAPLGFWPRRTVAIVRRFPTRWVMSQGAATRAVTIVMAAARRHRLQGRRLDFWRSQSSQKIRGAKIIISTREAMASPRKIALRVAGDLAEQAAEE